ncbi:MAG: HD domain-containing protein, partial [archaeon]
MQLDKEIEDKLKVFVKEVFAEDDWDYLHTLASVNAMRKIISAEGGDERILVTTMYLHDVGYAGSLANGYSLEQRLEVKSKHMQRGVEKAKVLLPSLGFSPEEIDKICYFIGVHDKLEELTSKEELLVLEADSLGAIDPTVGAN